MLKRCIVLVSIYRDNSQSEIYFSKFQEHTVLNRLKAIDSRARRKGLAAIDPSKNPLISIGMEVDEHGAVSKNGYGVFNLSWQAEQHPEWPDQVKRELEEVRRAIREAHQVPLRFLIWAGMGGSAEDKSMYNALGLLKRGPRCYVLDSTDPAKLKFILEDMARRSRLALPVLLKSTLVVGMAMGMTSYEPVLNLEKLSLLYERNKINARSNFVYMTLPDSLLDRFGKKHGYRKVDVQLDGANTTAGRHSAPLTRGSLYPLGLAGVDLRSWISGTVLSAGEIENAWKLACYLHAQGLAGRDKVTLLLPKQWAGAALWTKQNFEESLGKREDLGIKIAIDERMRLTNYRAPKDPRQDRVFLAIQMKGMSAPDKQRIQLVRRAGYPIATITLPAAELSRYMQFIHYAVFGMAWLRNMNFVTQPSVELYKSIANRLMAEARRMGGIEKTKEWQKMRNSPRRVQWRSGVTLNYDRLAIEGEPTDKSAPGLYSGFLRELIRSGQVEYGELTFFGDTRYSPQGRAARVVLNRAAETLFHSCLKMPVDVYEGPAMNHSYHEMIIGHGKCFSTVLLCEKSELFAAADYGADYHKAQFMATQMALAERGRPVVAITLKDLEPSTLASLDECFRQCARLLKS